MAYKDNSVFVLLLLATSGLAQTVDSKAVNRQTNHDLQQQVALARCAYSRTDAVCDAQSVASGASDTGGQTTMAQMPRRMGPMGAQQGPPMRGMRAAGYPDMWGAQPSTAHVLIGAAIGFTFGAIAGSKNGVRSSFAVGTLVGLLGAGIGAGIPSFPSHYRYRRGWDDDEDASLRKTEPGKRGSPQPNNAAKIATSRPEATETYQKNDFSGR